MIDDIKTLFDWSLFSSIILAIFFGPFKSTLKNCSLSNLSEIDNQEVVLMNSVRVCSHDKEHSVWFQRKRIICCSVNNDINQWINKTFSIHHFKNKWNIDWTSSFEFLNWTKEFLFGFFRKKRIILKDTKL